MAFHETQFPVDISYGSSGGPGYRTTVIQSDSGAEQRIARWSQARHVYDVAKGLQTDDQWATLLTFYHARQGAANGFRYKDWADFASDSTHKGTPTDTDQLVEVGDGTETEFQLVKRYIEGAITRVRTIRKPTAGTTVVSIDDVAQPTGWTVDTTTGIITFASAPALNEQVKAGYEFDVPVRFGEEVDAVLNAQQAAWNATNLDSIPIVELLEDEAIPEDFYFGGATYHATVIEDTNVSFANGRVQRFNVTVASKSLFLPDATDLPTGAPWLYFTNAGSQTVTVKNSGGATLTTITAGSTIVLLMGLDASSVKTWYSI